MSDAKSAGPIQQVDPERGYIIRGKTLLLVLETLNSVSGAQGVSWQSVNPAMTGLLEASQTPLPAPQAVPDVVDDDAEQSG